VITVANLSEPVNIEPGGDFVRLVSYVWGVEVSDEVTYGNYPGSDLDCIYLGESVFCMDSYEFGIDSSPTIGFSNEYNEVGFLSHFSGKIFNLDGNPIGNGFITVNGNFYMTITPDEQGSFDRIVLSRRYTFDTIQHYVPPSPYTIYTYTIEPIDFCVRPDSSHYQDIITTSLVIGVEEPEKPDDNTVTVAPNPFSDKIDFYFSLKNQQGENEFTIYSLDGKKILQVSLDEDKKKFEWQPSAVIPSGTYIYRLENQNKILKTGKFIKL
jgi:hypothetical protein